MMSNLRSGTEAVSRLVSGYNEEVQAPAWGLKNTLGIKSFSFDHLAVGQKFTIPRRIESFDIIRCGPRHADSVSTIKLQGRLPFRSSERSRP